MIYLLRSYGLNNSSILKVGFSDQVDKRMSQYFYHNPFILEISKREGDEMFETLLHFYLKSLGYQRKVRSKLDEWYFDCPEVYTIFHISRESLERELWKNRAKYFSGLSSFLIPSTEKMIYEYLREKNLDLFIGEEFIVKDGKVRRTHAPKIDILYKKYLVSNSADSPGECENIVVSDFLTNQFYTTGLFHEKMRRYCEFRDQFGNNPEILEHLFFKIPDQRFRMFYEYYGTKGCSSRKYLEKELEQGWKNATLEDKLKIEMSSRFKPGEKHTLEDLKVIIQEMYDRLGIKKKAKAKDLDQYFKLVKTLLPGIDKKTGEEKMKHGFKIVGVL